MIKMMWIAQGCVVADVVEENDEAITVESPVFLMAGQNAAQMVPILALTDTRKIEINRSELLFNGSLLEPLPELRNHYSSSFGSGIQLLNG